MQRSCETRYAISKLAIGQSTARIDVGRLIGPTGGEIALQNVGGEIVVTWDCAHGHTYNRFCRVCFRDCHCYSSQVIHIMQTLPIRRNAVPRFIMPRLMPDIRILL